MDYGAIDLHKKESQIRIVTEGGEACCAKTRPEQEQRIGQTFGIPRSYLHGHSALSRASSRHSGGKVAYRQRL